MSERREQLLCWVARDPDQLTGCHRCRKKLFSLHERTVTCVSCKLQWGADVTIVHERVAHISESAGWVPWWNLPLEIRHEALS